MASSEPATAPAAENPPSRSPPGGLGTASVRPPKTRISALLGLSLAEHELERIALLATLLFLSALLLVVGRTARDALFLTRYPVTWIAPMWIAYGAVSTVVGLAYERILRRLPRARLGLVFALGSAATYLVLRILIGHDIGPAYLIFAVWSEVIANLTAMLSWSIAQDLYDARSAKRVFGLIGVGRVVGTVASGLMAGAIAPAIGAENLILVLIAALLAVALLCSIAARRHASAAPPRTGERALMVKHEQPATAGSRYVVVIVATIFLLYTILTVGDYQFKAIARTAFPDRDSLARYMGTFYGLVGVVGVFVQLVVTPRMLGRFGVLGGAATLPAAFFSSTALLLGFPSIATATLLKASDNALQFSIFDATLQILLFPFPAATQDRVRTFAFAIAKPLGYGVGAVLLVLFTRATASAQSGQAVVETAAKLGFLNLPLGLLLVPLLVTMRRGYVEAMQHTLVRSPIKEDVPAQKGRVGKALAKALASADAPQVLFAMDRLRQIDPERLRDALPTLATSPSARVRASALRFSWSFGHPEAAEIARARLHDPNPDVRGIAVEALAHALGEDAHEELTALATSNDNAVKASAIAALLRFGGLDGMLEGAPKLRALLDSPQASDRVLAARALGLIGQPTLERAVARLCTDEDLSVRKAALLAASTVGTPKLVPVFLDALEERSLVPAAQSAILAQGDRAIPFVVEVLSDPDAKPSVRLMLPRILARIGTTSALLALLDRTNEPDDRVRQKVLASASRLRLSLGAPPAPLEPIRACIEREAAAHEQARDAWLSVRTALATPLFEEQTRKRLRKGLIRILRLAELVYPREVVAGVRAHVFGQDSALRANAFEVLESLLARKQGARLVRLFERYADINGTKPDKRQKPSVDALRSFVRTELEARDPYRSALVLDAIAENHIVSCSPEALSALASDDPLVREAAAIAVAETNPPGASDALKQLLYDPDPVVVRWAEYWQRTGRSGNEQGDGMYTTIEKVLFLQRVPILSQISGEELAPLARTAEVLSLREGEVIFRQGEPGAALYFVISGAVALLVDGKEVARLGPDDVFGEASIFEKEPRAATAVADGPVELLRVSAEDFNAAAHDTSELAIGVIHVMSHRLRDADRRVTRLQEEVNELRKLAGRGSRDISRPSDPGRPRHGWEDDE